ncbi:ClpX C4-type zinc finger protein [Hyalangium rubrum]|uniref:ClpX C4-type zinc finger protein n=1 Tax=Hyalangium rubrum TaxID=3103134 RepID=A0ABU5H5Q1_9BACT|nr:ClpX C4-type zinc finger protein [Hyalangium sp. s54d21]MDY7228194.1 ClpX C4-type zinc finger protein [Hyalangium sp. s54d21]
MANPRDHIRAAQAAELRGDKASAIAELRQAAELYRSSGNPARALHLLRHAKGLDPSSEELSEEIRQAEEAPETSEDGERVLELKPSPEELAERQRLIEEALREAGVHEAGKGAQDEVQRWLVEEPSAARRGAPRDLLSARERALKWAQQEAEEEEALREWSGDAAEALPVGTPPIAGAPNPASVSLEVKALVGADMKALVAEVETLTSLSDPEEPFPEEMMSSESEPAREPSRADPSLFDRGPTRADPSLDAWCSFCCRPRAEVGELVAGPTGSFICAACVGESQGLLGLEGAAPAARPQPARRKDDARVLELVGQAEARALLERGLQAGARRLLVMGPEGCGKTVWLHELASQERGALMTLEALEQGGGGPVALVEDVDRLSPEEQARLGAFLARHPERTVVMSARGTSNVPSLRLQGAAGSLPVFTTSAVFPLLRGAVPMALLDQVQLVIPLREPTEAEFIEIARRRLALRGPEVSLSDEVLAAFASEAARSPRFGHELSALLSRVLAGSWSLQGASPDSQDDAGGKPPARRGRRKGAP